MTKLPTCLACANSRQWIEDGKLLHECKIYTHDTLSPQQCDEYTPKNTGGDNGTAQTSEGC